MEVIELVLNEIESISSKELDVEDIFSIERNTNYKFVWNNLIDTNLIIFGKFNKLINRLIKQKIYYNTIKSSYNTWKKWFLIYSHLRRVSLIYLLIV